MVRNISLESFLVSKGLEQLKAEQLLLKKADSGKAFKGRA